MLNDQLEFQLSQYLDGSLAADEVAAFEARLAEDAAARELLEEYRKLNALLKAPAALPDLAWDRFADHICSAVAGADELEFAVSQYVDGTLPAGEVPAIEARLADDATAQGLVDEHRKVLGALKSAPLPAVRWDRLAKHLSTTVAEANEPATIKLFARPWVRGLAGLAVAACVAIVSTMGIRGLRSQHQQGPGPLVDVLPGSDRTVAAKSIEVQIGAPDFDGGSPAARTAVAADVTISAGADTPGGESAPTFAEGIVARSPRSLIATGSPTAQDSAVMPY
jgi:anti-sigma factor RsiW